MADDVAQSIEAALKQTMAKAPSYDLKIECSERYPEPPALPAELIQGVLRFGHKLVLAGPPDCGKTSLLLAMGLSVAQGKPWLEHATSMSHVLFVNLELEGTSFIHRVHQVAAACGLSACDKRFHFTNHRGGNLDPERFTLELRQQIVEAKLRGTDIRLVIIDPVYKLVGSGGTDENSNLRASQLISGLGMIAEVGDISFALSVDVPNDHPSYQVTQEIENGVGQMARDADSLLTLWPLERHDSAFRLKGQMREFESFPHLSLTFVYPAFQAAPELDRVPLVGSTLSEANAVEEPILNEISIWKVWDSLNTQEAVPLDQLAKLMNLTAFDVRQKVLQAGPHPTRPSLKLRMAVGNRVKAEE